MTFNIEKISRDLMPKDFQNVSNATWTLQMQFDDDAPAALIENIRLGERISISWTGPGELSQIKFTDPVTKKTFKLFGRLDK
jgi:hypothetical protein